MDELNETLYPPCFNSLEQFSEWASLAEETGVGRFQFCLDCTRSYQAKMVYEGRCEFPETQFTVITNEDGEQEEVGCDNIMLEDSWEIKHT